MSAHRWTNTSGQAMVETALVLPLLLLIVVGMVEMGAFLHQLVMVNNAAREACRLGALGADDAEIIGAVQSRLTVDNGVGISIEPGSGNRARGQALSVTVEYEYGFMTPVLSRVIDPVTISAQTTMRIE